MKPFTPCICMLPCLFAIACSDARFSAPEKTVASVEQAVSTVSGKVPWLVVLCYPSDASVPPPQDTQSFYNGLFATRGIGGIADYWHDQSNGKIDVTGTKVINWQVVKDQFGQTANSQAVASWSRDMQISNCVNLQRNMPNFATFYNYMAIYNFNPGQGALGEATSCIGDWPSNNCRNGTWHLAVTADTGSGPTQIEHEMGHGFSLNHSFADKIQPCSDGDGTPGAYCDPYDIMSAMDVYTFSGSQCVYSPTDGCFTGPGLNMWNRLQLGWVNNVGQFPSWPVNDSVTTVLASRSHPENSNYPVLIIPAHQDSGYEVEYITNEGWDRGLSYAAPAVLVHRYYYNGTNPYTPYGATPFLLVERGGVQVDTSHPFDEGSVRIALQSNIQNSPTTANLHVSYTPGYASSFAGWTGGSFNGQFGDFVADVTGDGKGDLVALNFNGNNVSVMRSAGSSFSAVQQWWGAAFNGQFGNFVADVTGDGKADLVGLGNGYVGVVPAVPQGRGQTGTGFGTYAQPINFTFNGQLNFAADVTGDGKVDIVGLGNGYTGVLVSTSNDSQVSFQYQGWNAGATGVFGTLLADVTGDGKADLIALNSNSVTVMPSTGSGWGPAVTWLPFVYYGQIITLAADVTGDGKADLIGISNGAIGLAISTGQSFAYETWSTLTAPTPANFIRASDVTGDGMADIVDIGNTVKVLTTVKATQ